MSIPYFVMLLLWIFSLSECAPVPLEMVDMTYTFDETTLYWPGAKEFQLNVIFNGTTDDEGNWFQVDEYASSTHTGTHIDAPCHFALGGWCVDEIPIERLVAPAAVVDITDKATIDPDAMVEIEDLQQWETLSGRCLNKSIVVMRSGWGRRWGDREAYFGTTDNGTSNLHFPGMSPEAAQWLVDNRNIYGVASESVSVDNGPSTEFMSHRILYTASIYGLENVANVEEIPIVGATLYVMPLKIGKGSGAPTRILATYPKVICKTKDAKCIKRDL